MQAKWAEILSSYNFVIEHLEGKKNPADGPSRRRNYFIGYEKPTAQLLATLVPNITVEPYDDLLPAITIAQQTDSLVIGMKSRINDTPSIENLDSETGEQWRRVAEALTDEGRLYVPEAPQSKVKTLFHSNPESGHFGALKTAELVSRDLYWLAMNTTVQK